MSWSKKGKLFSESRSPAVGVSSCNFLGEKYHAALNASKVGRKS